jgi:signal transduction histidine kinase
MEAKDKRQQRSSLLWKGSTLQLLGVIIFPLAILVLIFSLGGAFAHQQAMRRMIGERDTLAVSAAASTLSAELNHRMSAMRALAQRASENIDVPEETLASSDYLMADFDRGMALVSADGRLLASTGDVVFWNTLIVSEDRDLLEWLRAQVEPEGQGIETLFEPSTGIPMIVVAASSPDGSLFSLGALRVETLANQALLPALPNQESARLLLVGKSGELLFESNFLGGGEDFETHPGVANALAGQVGTTYLATKNDEHVVAYSPVEPVGWALIIEESWQTVTTPFLRTTEIAPLALVPLLLISLVGLWFGARQIVQPLRDLEKRSARLAWGDFHAVDEPVGGIMEIRRLQTELAQMARKVQAAQNSLHDYIGEITEAQEEERLRLARELHDGTLQSLIALKQRVQLANKASTPDPKVQAGESLEKLIEQTIEDLRRTTRALRPIYLEDLGLVTALEMLAREMKNSTNIDVSFSFEGNERRLTPSVELALYRIAQEALSNVARHAQATKAVLQVKYEKDRLTLQVIDNGVGFQVPESPGEFAPSGHFGLLGLYERAELIGASLRIKSEAGKGTQLTIQLPFQGKEMEVIK